MSDNIIQINDQTMYLISQIGSNISDGFFVFRADTQEIIFANDAVFRLYGCSGKDEFSRLTADRFNNMIHPDDFEAAAEYCDAVRNNRSRPPAEYRIIRKDGTVSLAEDKKQFIRTENGDGLFLSFIRDISEKCKNKRCEEYYINKKNVQSAAKIADFIASSSSLLSERPAMSFIKDAETGKYIACNQPFAEYAHKASPNEVEGLTDHQIFDKTTADHFVEDDKKALSMDKPYIFFEDVPDAAGTEIRKLQTTKTKFRDASDRICILGMCVDVTEMTRVRISEAASQAKQQELEIRLALQDKLLKEKNLRKQQDMMINALASDYRSVYHIDLDKDEGICYRADLTDDEQTKEGIPFPYLERFRWYAENSVAESFREGFLDFIDPDNIRRGLSENSIISHRYLVKRKGREYYEMIRAAGVRHPSDRDDNIVHAIGLGLTNIDSEMRDHMARNRALADALTAAQEANKAKTSFLSSMSHEIRTPMNAIIGLDNIALNDPDISPKTRDYLEKIGTSANHLLSLINDILDMSRIESGRLTLKSEEFSFSKLLEQINTMFSSQSMEKGSHYNCYIKGTIDDYYIGDNMKLKQVLINILGNAVKFTPKGGNIDLTVERTARFNNKSTLRFTITDTGIGISEEYLPHIFDSFSQEDSSSTNKYGSSGLGLAITKSLVEMMNGQIEVKSKKGSGTVFTVSVTLLDSERKFIEKDENEFDTDHMSVLVIDDDPIACEHAGLVLRKIGLSCDTAFSGEEAINMIELRHARHEPYSFILADLKIPGMDGIETTKKIRSISGNESAMIILTAYMWDDILDKAVNAGVDGFIAKPIFANNIIDELRKVLKKRQASEDTVHPADLNGKHILLAEDIEINAEIIRLILAEKNVIIDHAENGRVAVEKFASSEQGYYDSILMDVRMPETDGLEATAAIRAMDRSDAEKIPIIAMTANAFDEDVKHSLQVGMDAHLSKPVEPERLYQTLEELIGKYRATPPAVRARTGQFT